MPLWASIIKRHLEKGVKFYFAGAGNRIYDIFAQEAAGVMTVSLRLEHVKRKKNGRPDRQTYTIWERAFNDWTLKKFEDGFKLTMVQNTKKINEEQENPLWATIIQKHLPRGHKFYHDLGTTGRITSIEVLPERGEVELYLEFPSGSKTVLKIWEEKFNNFTLKNFKDGHKLVALEQPKEEKINEDASDPLVVSLFQKLINAGQNVYFLNKAAKLTQLFDWRVGLSTTGGVAYWFYDKNGREVVWKTGDNINKLSITKLTKNGKQIWALYDKTAIKLVEEEQFEPMVVRLMNQRINKKGAVAIDIDVLPVGKKLKGWVTEPIEKVGSMNGLGLRTPNMFKIVVHNDRPASAKKVFYLMYDADSKFTLKLAKDKNNNPTIKLVNRETT